MLFSIVIPVYNVEKYLNECVDSILNQSCTDFELILVDDGSTDNSPNICDEYEKRDTRVKVIHKENGGQSTARNAGTGLAEGEYIIYIDSDDYVCSNLFLEKIKEKTVCKPDIICYKFKKYFEKDKTFGECNFNFPDIGSKKDIAEKVLYMVEHDAFYCAAWAKAVKTSIIKDNKILFESGLLGEDQEWYYHILLNSNTIEGIDEEFIVYRQREGSTTKTVKLKNLDDCVNIIEKWYKTINSVDISIEYKDALLNSLAKLYCNMLIMFVGLNDAKKEIYYLRIKELSKLFKYDKNKRTKTFRKVYKVFGFKITLMLLKLIIKLR